MSCGGSQTVGRIFKLLRGACKKAPFTSREATSRSRCAARFKIHLIATVSMPPTDGSGSPGWGCLEVWFPQTTTRPFRLFGGFLVATASIGNLSKFGCCFSNSRYFSSEITSIAPVDRIESTSVLKAGIQSCKFWRTTSNPIVWVCSTSSSSTFMLQILRVISFSSSISTSSSSSWLSSRWIAWRTSESPEVTPPSCTLDDSSLTSKSFNPSLMLGPLHSPPAREARRAGWVVAGFTTVCLP